METTNVYKQNIRAFREGHQLIINQGGARSSKTFSILQLLAVKALGSKQPLIISCVGQSMPNVKLGMLRDFRLILESIGLVPDLIENKTDHSFNIGRSVIEFFSSDNPGKVHGPQRDILFINEAYFISQEIYDALAVRTSGCKFIDFNPCSSFWVHEDLMLNNQHKLIHSTYKDNSFLSAEQVAVIESKRNNEQWWKVYGLGEIGSFEGQVFTNWEVGEFDNRLQVIYGQDYGFSSDPTTLIKIAVDEKLKRLYVKECFYKTGLTTDQIVTLNKQFAGRSLIIGDSSEPRLINDLKLKGCNIEAADKGPGSIEAGVRDMQDYRIIVDPSSTNLMKEFRNYQYVSRGSQIFLDDFNHGIDAIRYGLRKLHNGKPRITQTYSIGKA